MPFSICCAPAVRAETLATFVTIASIQPALRRLARAWAVKYSNCRLQRAMGVCERSDKVARSVIANGRDGAASGRWDGRQLTGQIDPKLTLSPRHRNRSSCPIPAVTATPPQMSRGRKREFAPDFLRELSDCSADAGIAVRKAHHPGRPLPTDADFDRFLGLRRVDPCAADGAILVPRAVARVARAKKLRRGEPARRRCRTARSRPGPRFWCTARTWRRITVLRLPRGRAPRGERRAEDGPAHNRARRDTVMASDTRPSRLHR